MSKGLLLIALIFSTTSAALAQESEASPWKHESEVALVTTSGNTQNESTSAKQKTSYTFDQNILTNTARYLRSRTAGTESARNWDLGLRYERTLSEQWGLFVAHMIESDTYSGYVQRDFTDIGAKYTISKTDKHQWLAEAGYRYSDTYTTGGQHVYANLGRLYSEYSQQLNETVSFKLWAEYLPNMTVSEAYLANGEASVTSILSQIFSLKLAYLAKYQNLPPAGAPEKTDTVFTTSLVAKF